MRSEWDDPRDIYIPATGRTQPFDVQDAGIHSAPASMPSVGGGSTTVHFNRQNGELILNCYHNGVDLRLASKAATYYRGQYGPDAVKTVVFLISPDTMLEEGAMLHSRGYERIGEANARGQYRWQKHAKVNETGP